MSHLLCIAAAARRNTTINSVASGSVSRNEVSTSSLVHPFAQNAALRFAILKLSVDIFWT